MQAHRWKTHASQTEMRTGMVRGAGIQRDMNAGNKQDRGSLLLCLYTLILITAHRHTCTSRPTTSTTRPKRTRFNQHLWMIFEYALPVRNSYTILLL